MIFQALTLECVLGVDPSQMSVGGRSLADRSLSQSLWEAGEDNKSPYEEVRGLSLLLLLTPSWQKWFFLSRTHRQSLQDTKKSPCDYNALAYSMVQIAI